VRKQARAVLDELAAVMFGIADALRACDPAAAGAALRRARASQPLVDALRSALASGREVVSVAPLRRPHRRALVEFAELADRADYALRNARVLARRALTAIGDGEAPVEALPDAVAGLATAVQRLAAELGPDGDRTKARDAVLAVVHDASVLNDELAGSLGMSEQVMVAQVRSIAIDLLQATGMRRSDALATLRAAL
jgi:hypothetical protein